MFKSAANSHGPLPLVPVPAGLLVEAWPDPFWRASAADARLSRSRSWGTQIGTDGTHGEQTMQKPDLILSAAPLSRRLSCSHVWLPNAKSGTSSRDNRLTYNQAVSRNNQTGTALVMRVTKARDLQNELQMGSITGY